MSPEQSPSYSPQKAIEAPKQKQLEAGNGEMDENFEGEFALERTAEALQEFDNEIHIPPDSMPEITPEKKNSAERGKMRQFFQRRGTQLRGVADKTNALFQELFSGEMDGVQLTAGERLRILHNPGQLKQNFIGNMKEFVGKGHEYDQLDANSTKRKVFYEKAIEDGDEAALEHLQTHDKKYGEYEMSYTDVGKEAFAGMLGLVAARRIGIAATQFTLEYQLAGNNLSEEERAEKEEKLAKVNDEAGYGATGSVDRRTAKWQKLSEENPKQSASEAPETGVMEAAPDLPEDLPEVEEATITEAATRVAGMVEAVQEGVQESGHTAANEAAETENQPENAETVEKTSRGMLRKLGKRVFSSIGRTIRNRAYEVVENTRDRYIGLTSDLQARKLGVQEYFAVRNTEEARNIAEAAQSKADIKHDIKTNRESLRDAATTHRGRAVEYSNKAEGNADILRNIKGGGNALGAYAVEQAMKPLIGRAEKKANRSQEKADDKKRIKDWHEQYEADIIDKRQQAKNRAEEAKLRRGARKEKRKNGKES